MGLCITPLTTTVLASASPQSAGAVSGALSTMQQVGNSLGVAVTGVIFFGALRAATPAPSAGPGRAGRPAGRVAALTRLLPRPPAAEGDSER